jgi:hypothetical protein
MACSPAVIKEHEESKYELQTIFLMQLIPQILEH